MINQNKPDFVFFLWNLVCLAVFVLKLHAFWPFSSGSPAPLSYFLKGEKNSETLFNKKATEGSQEIVRVLEKQLLQIVVQSEVQMCNKKMVFRFSVCLSY